MSCHPFKLCAFPSTCSGVQSLAPFLQQTYCNAVFIQAIRQLPNRCESNVNDKAMVHLPKGQAVSHQLHIKGQVGHSPF